MKFECGCGDDENGFRLCASHTDPVGMLGRLTPIVDLENAVFTGTTVDLDVSGVKHLGLWTVWIYFDEEKA